MQYARAFEKNPPKGKQICNSVIKLQNELPTIPLVGITAVLCSAHLPVRAFTFALHDSRDIRRAWAREDLHYILDNRE